MRNTLRTATLPVLAITLILMTTAIAANASLTTYSTPASFNSATTGLTTQTFAFLSATIPTGGSGTMNNPLNSATSNAFVSPGDIAAGLDIAALNGSDIFLMGPNFNGGGNTNYAVFANDFAAPLQLTFSPGVTAVSLDVLATSAGHSPVQVSVYSPSSALLGSFNLSATLSGGGLFFGVTSGSPIGSVTLTGPQHVAVGVDQVQFGSAVPEPSTLLLLGSGLLGAVGTLKKRLR